MCVTCITSQRGQDEALINSRVQAKEMALQLQKPIAIVFQENEFVLYDAFVAYQNHLDVKEVISHLC